MLARQPAGPLVLLLSLASALSSGCSSDGGGPTTIDQVIITAVDGSVTPSVRRGQTVQLQAQAMSGGKQVANVQFNWTSQSPSIASVDNTGRVSGLEYGTARITATPVDGGATGQIDVAVVGAPVASVQVVAPEFVDIGDDVQLHAFSFDQNGAPLVGVEYEWRSVNMNAQVDQTGKVTGVQAGSARIEAITWNNVVGGTDITVTPVTGIEPDTGRYGQPIIVRGNGLPASPQLFFTSDDEDGWVRAYTFGGDAVELLAWVPVNARTGPLSLVTQSDGFSTSREFTLTAQEDIFASISDQGFVAGLPVPFLNPSLLARNYADHLFWFEIEEASPFTFYLLDDGPDEGNGEIYAFVLRAEQTDDGISPTDALAWIESRSNDGARQRRDVTAYSRTQIEPGLYVLIAYAVGDAPTRPFGIVLDTQSDFAQPPDAYEPNDFPAEAPLITLPFNETGLAFENVWAFDHYVFELNEAATVTASAVGSANVEVGLYLIAGSETDLVVDHFFAPAPNPNVLQTAFGGDPLVATLDAGTYTLAVWELTGNAGTYDLEITAAPPALAGAFQLAGPPVRGELGRRLAAPADVIRDVLAPRKLVEPPYPNVPRSAWPLPFRH